MKGRQIARPLRTINMSVIGIRSNGHIDNEHRLGFQGANFGRNGPRSLAPRQGGSLGAMVPGVENPGLIRIAPSGHRSSAQRLTN
jgi:hypothetical protein